MLLLSFLLQEIFTPATTSNNMQTTGRRHCFAFHHCHWTETIVLVSKSCVDAEEVAEVLCTFKEDGVNGNRIIFWERFPRTLMHSCVHLSIPTFCVTLLMCDKQNAIKLFLSVLGVQVFANLEVRGSHWTISGLKWHISDTECYDVRRKTLISDKLLMKHIYTLFEILPS